MARVKIVSKYVFAIFFVAAGARHFVETDFYVSIMPPYIWYHLELVYLSGLAEIVLGIALVIPPLSRAAAWGIIALLLAVFPANVHLYQNQEIWPLDPLIHFIRLPFQIVFILWAYWYTRPDADNRGQSTSA